MVSPEEAKKLYGYAAGGEVQMQGRVTMDEQGSGQFGQTGFGQQGANGYRPAGNGFTGNNNSAPQNLQSPSTKPFDELNQGRGQSYEDYVNGPMPMALGYKHMTREEFDANKIQGEQQRKAGFFGLGRPPSSFGGGLQGGLAGLFGNMQQGGNFNQQQFSSYADGGVAIDPDRPTETPALQAFKQMQAQRAAQPPAPQIDANAEFAKYAQQTVGAPNQMQAPTAPPPTSTSLASSGYSYDPIKQQYGQIQGTAPAELAASDDPLSPVNLANNPGVPHSRIDPKTGAMVMYDRYGNVMNRYASGGVSHLGDYSDGGRLLRGPGDGVSDSIPAMIGKRQPARLADGEFVVPARIVSELGNGSTEAGARKLYAMMDRIQKARGKTVGKNKVAKNSRSEKYLPA